MDKNRYQIDKLRNRKTGFPLATIAYYGPDDRRATKVVVGIYLSEIEKQPNLKKWFAKELDVRLETSIVSEIIDYIVANSVRRVSMVG